MNLYVYCLAENVAELTQPVTGISGAKVELIELEGFKVLVSEFDGSSVPVTRDNVLAHDAAVRSVLDVTTPLPFRFGSVVAEQQLASFLSARRAALETKLAQVRGCLEMSVKIIWETDQADIAPEDNELGPGATFLQQKRREILGGEQRAARAKEVSSWLHEQVGMVVKDEQTSLSPTQKLIVAAAHLIKRDRIQQYREQLVEIRKMRPELHFLVSGPWPPYSFSNIDLEFQTRFGVS